MVNPGSWVTLRGKTPHAKNRVEQHGSAWLVLEVGDDRMRVRSAEKTEGPKRRKRYDGRWVWLVDDVDYEWR